MDTNIFELMTTDRINDRQLLLRSIAGKKILVIGDIMLDHYIWGDVHRISPEAPVPVVSVIKDTYSAGGAANVALNLANLGVSVSLYGYIAEDEAGNQLKLILKNNNVQHIKPLCNQQPPTIIKTRVITRNQQLCRIDREAGKEAYCITNTEDANQLLQTITQNVQAVIVSDYAKGIVSQSLLDQLLNIAAHQNQLLIAVDPKPSHQLHFEKVGLLTPNRTEALELAGLPNHFTDDTYPLELVCEKIYEKYHPELLIVTLGAGGMVISKQGKILKHLPTHAREVFDVSGAGDTVIAALTAALAAGAAAETAAGLANIAAGCVVAHMGTVPINYNELANKLNSKDE